MKAGDLVQAVIGGFTVVKNGEIIQVPIWHNDLWIIKDLSTNETFQLSSARTVVTLII